MPYPEKVFMERMEQARNYVLGNDLDDKEHADAIAAVDQLKFHIDQSNKRHKSRHKDKVKAEVVDVLKTALSRLERI